jgi:hypothetical protein
MARINWTGDSFQAGIVIIFLTTYYSWSFENMEAVGIEPYSIPPLSFMAQRLTLIVN